MAKTTLKKCPLCGFITEAKYLYWVEHLKLKVCDACEEIENDYIADVISGWEGEQ